MITRNKSLGTSLNDKAAILALDTLLLNLTLIHKRNTLPCFSHCYLWNMCYIQLNYVIMNLVPRIGPCKTEPKICRWPSKISGRKILSIQMLNVGKLMTMMYFCKYLIELLPAVSWRPHTIIRYSHWRDGGKNSKY